MPLDNQEEFVAVLCLRGLVVPSPAWKDLAAELRAEGAEELVSYPRKWLPAYG
jgi:hypothetical protein